MKNDTNISRKNDEYVLRGKRLREVREGAGLSIKEFVEKLIEVDPYCMKDENQIRQIENGHRNLSTKSAELFSQVLNVRSAYLLGLDTFVTIQDKIQHVDMIKNATNSINEIIAFDTVVHNLGYEVNQIIDTSIDQNKPLDDSWQVFIKYEDETEICIPQSFYTEMKAEIEMFIIHRFESLKKTRELFNNQSGKEV